MTSKGIEQHFSNNSEPPLATIMSFRLTFPQRSFFSSICYGFPFILLLLISGCESTPHRAPVVESAAVEAQEIKAGTETEAAGQRPEFYTVQKGDTLYSIARSRGIDQKDLAEWNNIQDPGAIHIGQQLTLSSPSRPSQPSLFAIPQPMAPPSPAAAAPNAVPLDEKPGINTNKLKVEPKAFKLPYSDQAVAQLKAGVAIVPPIVVAKAVPMTERNAGGEISPVAPVAPVAPAMEAIDEVDRVEWIWPTKGKVLDGFSESTKGIDIAGKSGQPVTASAGGKVVYSGAGLRGYGKLIIIKHNNTYLSAYAHNDKILVKEGQTVTKGQKIAEMGNTDTTAVKLHFEIRKNGKPVDPLKYLPELSG